MNCPKCGFSGYYTYSSKQSRLASGFNKTYQFKCRICENVIDVNNSHEDVNSQVLIVQWCRFRVKLCLTSDNSYGMNHTSN